MTSQQTGKELVKIGTILASSDILTNYIKEGGFYLIRKDHPTLGPRYEVYAEKKEEDSCTK